MSAAIRTAIEDASEHRAPTSAADSSKTATSRPTAVTRHPSKFTVILKLLRRRRGATLAELQIATGWQAHSLRGFLSGTVRKRMKLALKSEAGANGVRRYQIATAAADTNPASGRLDAATADGPTDRSA